MGKDPPSSDNHSNVIFLKRVAIGTIKLGGLTRGTCRLLKPSEIEYLKSL